MIGYVGLGKMGGALARRLALSNDVLAWDLGAEARDWAKGQGLKLAEGAAALAKACDVIFLCLPTSQHVEAALIGPQGMGSALRPGTIVIDQTSGDPKVTREVAAKLKGQGVILIDAPVSGGPSGADAGTIALMVGADAETFAKVEPVMKTISPNIFHVGEVGAGNVAKLANNMLSAGIRLMTIEAVILAVKNGLTAQTAVDVFKASGGGSFWLNKYGQSLLVEGKIGTNFALGLSNKDVRLACQMGTDSGTPLLFGNQARAVLQMAMNQYDDSLAVTVVAYLMEKLAGADFLPGDDALN